MIKITIRKGRHKNKVSYNTINTALKACTQMEKKGRFGLTPYMCKVCSKYHIGHKRSFWELLSSIRLKFN